MKVTRSRLDPARDQQHLLVLDVHALDRADALRGSRTPPARENGAVVNQPRSASQITGGFRHSSIVVQMENDGREVVAVDDRGSRRPGRRSRRSRRTARRRRSGRTRRTVRARRRCRPGPAGRPPPTASAAANCSSPSLTPALGVRPLGMRAGQRHRHVQVVRAGGEGAVEDRHDEARVDRVEDVGDRRARGTAAATASAEEASTWAAEKRASDRRRHRPLGPGQVVVGHDARARRSPAGPRCRPRPIRPRRRRRAERAWSHPPIRTETCSAEP